MPKEYYGTCPEMKTLITKTVCDSLSPNKSPNKSPSKSPNLIPFTSNFQDFGMVVSIRVVAGWLRSGFSYYHK